MSPSEQASAAALIPEPLVSPFKSDYCVVPAKERMFLLIREMFLLKRAGKLVKRETLGTNLGFSSFRTDPNSPLSSPFFSISLVESF